MKMHSEAAFETVLFDHMLSTGYVSVDDKLFDRVRAVFPSIALEFIQETQPKQWAKLEALHGDKTGERIVHDLCNWIDAHSCLATLRHGFKCYGRMLKIAYFTAVHDLNAELDAQYAANRVGVTRQLHYSTKN